MEIKELRIGNLVKWGIHECLIKGIHTDTVTGKDPYVYGSVMIGAMPIYTIEGIELTPEWLIRLGFKQGDNVTSNDSFYVIKLGVSELGINPDNGVCWITNRTGSINNPLCLYFVHQVQNLFYALTGEELAIDKTSLI